MNKKKWIAGGLIVMALAGGIYYFKSGPKTLTPSDFEMTAVDVGRISKEVTASGKIQPINTVAVGTQVSGIVEKVLADYNDEVEKGQLLAMLDTSVLVQNTKDTKARLDLANAKMKVAELNHQRYQKLFKDKLIAKATLEEAEVELASAEAEVLSAEASYAKAQREFNYASIVSPVSGTVISKEIEQGQTVASSFQTPTLFQIAEDLSKMQIEASIAEADIGMIVPKMPVTFTVDAYPNDVFNGMIKQIRLSPTEEQNVVMYTVVIEVDNSSRKLLPGMTAFVNVQIQELKDALRLPTTALQFKPNAEVRQFMDKQMFQLDSDQSIVYRFENGRVVPVVIRRGLSDTSYVQVLEGLKAGDRVIGEFIQKSGKRR